MITRNLHGKLPAPYYIYAPDYRETSSGICVMHYLCHALNIAGHEAYVALCDVVNPALRTPALTDQIIKRHNDLGRTPIVVYPEVVSGNPLSGPVVVRYILNRAGFLTGNSLQAGANDLFFHYAHDFRDESLNTNMLTLPVIDSELFSPPTEPVERRKSYLYLHRHQLRDVDFASLPTDIEILSLSKPKTLAQLAEIFKSADVLYSYEISATCTEAMLCGCPVIYLQGGHIDTLPFTEHFGDAGAAMHYEPGGLARARASLPQARERWLEIETTFWEQFEDFIHLTQKAVVDHKANLHTRPLRDWLQARTLSAVQQQLIGERRNDLKDRTSVTAIVLDSAQDSALLNLTLASFGVWEPRTTSLRAVVFSTLPRPESLAPNIEWLSYESDIAQQMNTLLQDDASQWFTVLHAGDEWQFNGTLRMELELPAAHQCQMVYFDEIHHDGDVRGVALRPDFNLDLLLSFPVSMARHWFFQRDLALQAGGFVSAYSESLEFDLILRMIEQNGIGTIGHIDEPLMACSAPTLEQNSHELQTLKRHLLARDYHHADVIESPARHYHVQYGHLGQPFVSIIVPTKDQLPMLQRCIETVLEKTDYQHYEILIVDNNSETPEALEWLANIEAIGGQKVRVLRYPFPFNFSAMNNMAAAQARGDYLVLMNNDIAVLRADWLDKLLNHAQRPEVGIVGSKLLYPNATVQHAGVILGLRGPADHPFSGESATSAGYMQRRWLDQDLSAVTAACLIIRKSIYDDVGGMDEEAFKVSYNDVDLCLKVGALGYLTVWTPHALLLHEGSVSQTANLNFELKHKQDRFAGEQEAMYSKWLPKLARDPAYNRNMSLGGNGFDLESITPLTWQPMAWRPLPTVLAHPADVSESGHHRVLDPLRALMDSATVDGFALPDTLPVVDLQRYDPDVLILHRHLDEQRLTAMRRAKAFSSSFKVYDLDTDLFNLPSDHPDRSRLPEDLVTALEQGLSYVDRFVVSTPHMADLFSGFHGDLRVMENRLPPERWANLNPRRNRGFKPRVGILTDTDMHLLDGVIRQLINEVEWVFVGSCPDALRPCAYEIHGNPSIPRKAAALASLDLDLALVPLEQTLFNDAQGNQPLLEYGACGYPVICSNVRAYQGDLPVTRVANTTEAWVDAIRAHLHDLSTAARIGDQLRATVLRDWMLDDQGIQRWREVWLP
ncbi:glycosyltransferase [Pseudomonas abietaniphila]|jgi:GT2 family glycosyltransferase